ncbi:hypothetical protein [Chitinimonas lacunae]|uniref:Uncharacterized protein n=1 Tax=Chitinimonas lacunae TaxID=1963018 RepID=A0ABV8MJP4_9NEIS
MNPRISGHGNHATLPQNGTEEWQQIVAEERRQLEQKMNRLRIQRQMANRQDSVSPKGSDAQGDKWEEDEEHTERLNA